MHQILRNNALDISLYNSFVRLITACTVVQAVLTAAVTPLIPNLVMAVWLREHLKNDADHVHCTTYYVP